MRSLDEVLAVRANHDAEFTLVVQVGTAAVDRDSIIWSCESIGRFSEDHWVTRDWEFRLFDVSFVVHADSVNYGNRRQWAENLDNLSCVCGRAQIPWCVTGVDGHLRADQLFAAVDFTILDLALTVSEPYQSLEIWRHIYFQSLGSTRRLMHG